MNAIHDDGWTPLHYAVGNGHKEIAELLISKGADVNAKDKIRGNPLHYAVAYDYKEISVLLIAKGADVNAKDGKFGGTPLHYAAGGHKEILELLIAAGADVNVKAVDGETPLDLAIKKKHPEIADLLRKHGGKTGEELKAEGK